MSQAHTTGKVLASTVGAVGLLLATGQAANAASVTVNANDTVWGLAQKHGVSVKSIEKLNNIKALDENTDLIFVGQKIQVSGSKKAAKTATTTTKSVSTANGTYTVKAGDTLWALADQYHTSVHALQSANGISGDVILVGQSLQVPGATAKTATTKATTSAAAKTATSASSEASTASQAVSASSQSTNSTSAVSQDTTSTSAKSDASTTSTSSASTSSVSTNNDTSASASSSTTVKAVATATKVNDESQSTSAASQSSVSTASSTQAKQDTTSTTAASSQASSTATSSSTSATSSASQSSASQASSSVASQSTTSQATSSAASQSSTSQATSAATSSTSNQTSQASSSAATTNTNNNTATNSNADLATGSVTGLALKLASANIPYVWGGSSLSGMDCSGLVAYVYQHAAGISLPHNTVAQEGYVTTHSVADAKPGDILFWGSRGATYHDAIYIGNNQFVAAPQPGENVKVSTISSYFMPSFAGTLK